MIDIQQLIVRLLPPFYRRIKRVAWLYRLLAPTRRNLQNFFDYKEKVEFCRKWNSQTLRMETILNEVFPQGNGYIYIETTGNSLDLNYIHWVDEGQPPFYIHWLDENNPPTYIYWHQDYYDVTLNHDFIVHCPVVLQVEEEHIRRWVDKVRLASKRFTIEYF